MAKKTVTVDEAGRLLSAANERTLRNAVASIQKLLDGDGSADSSKADPKAVKEAIDMLQIAEAELSADEKSQAIRAAILSGIPAYPSVYVWIRALYDSYVIYEQSGDGDCTCFRRDYSLAADGAVTLGDATEVRMQMTWVPTSEPTSESTIAESIKHEGSDWVVYSADGTKKLGSYKSEDEAKKRLAQIEQFKSKESDVPDPDSPDLIALREAGQVVDLASDILPLVEKAIRDDGTMPVKLIAPGWGSSGYYSADMLQRDGPKVFRSGTHMYINHPTAQESQQRPERDIKDLAAVLSTDAVYREDAQHGPGLYAEAKVFNHWRPFVEEVAPFTGTSIRALGKPGSVQTIEGRKGKVIESLLLAQSVDLVTAAGAGGKVLQLFESARQYTEPQLKKEAKVGEEWKAEAFQQAQEADRRRIEELEERLKKADERDQLREASDIVRAELGRGDLPEVTRSRLAERLVRDVPFKDGLLDRDAFMEQIRESVKAEVAYISSITGGGRIRGMGAGEIGFPEEQVKASEARLQESFKRFGMSDDAAKVAAAGRR